MDEFSRNPHYFLEWKVQSTGINLGQKAVEGDTGSGGTAIMRRATRDKLTFEHFEFEILVRDLDVVKMSTEQLKLMR